MFNLNAKAFTYRYLLNINKKKSALIKKNAVTVKLAYDGEPWRTKHCSLERRVLSNK